MSGAIAEDIQVNTGSIREAVAASLNRNAEPPVELQPPEPAPVPAVDPIIATPPPPEETPVAAQTDIPVQIEESFELDLNKNPLDDTTSVEPAVAPPASRKQWEAGFQDFIKMNPRGQGIWSNHVAMQQLAAPPEEGGIGFKPEPDQIKQWQRTHSILDEMSMDFTSGQPDAAEKFVNYWFGKDVNGQVMDGASQIAESLPVILAKENPEAYQRIASHFDSTLVVQLQRLAATPGRDPSDAARLADAALVLGAVTGLTPAAAAPQTPAPNAELAAAQARIRELENGRAQQTKGQIENTVHRGIMTAIERDADAILAPLKKTYEANPEGKLIFDAMKAQVVSEMRQKARNNPAIWGEVSKEIARMERSGRVDRDQMNGVVRMWRKGYVDHAPQIRDRYLKAAGAAITAKADESRGILQQANEKTAPSMGSAPGSSMPNPDKQPGESVSDYIRRVVTTKNTRQ